MYVYGIVFFLLGSLMVKTDRWEKKENTSAFYNLWLKVVLVFVREHLNTKIYQIPVLSFPDQVVSGLMKK